MEEQYLEKWVASYEIAAFQKTQLERRLESQGERGVEIRNSDHPVLIMESIHGQSMATTTQATYGPDG